jgi:hypothetical protein
LALPVTIHDHEPPKDEIICHNGMTEMYGCTTVFAVGAFGIAPNNGPTVAHCLSAVALNEGISLGADIAGAIPVEGQALRIAQLGVGGVGFVSSLVNSDAPGAVGGILAGQTLGVGMAAKSLGVTALEAAPVVGNVLSAVMAVRDAYNGYQHYQSCMGGH